MNSIESPEIPRERSLSIGSANHIQPHNTISPQCKFSLPRASSSPKPIVKPANIKNRPSITFLNINCQSIYNKTPVSAYDQPDQTRYHLLHRDLNKVLLVHLFFQKTLDITYSERIQKARWGRGVLIAAK